MFSISSSETALTWLAIDFSEDEVNGITEKLAVRFKLAETKDEFKKIFEECQEKLKNKPPQSALNATAKVSDNFFHKYLHVSLIQLKEMQINLKAYFSHISITYHKSRPKILPGSAAMMGRKLKHGFRFTFLNKCKSSKMYI